MSVFVKICGLTDAAGIDAAVMGGAAFVGLVFYPPSPRYITPDHAAALAAIVPRDVHLVGLFVDASDSYIRGVLDEVRLDVIQLHGTENPARVSEIRSWSGRRIIKAVKIADAADLKAARDFEPVSDLLLFDAKPPSGGLPGGNAVSFDWSLLTNWPAQRPWLLAGGLTAGNLAQAVRASGAAAVDVSSGVEDSPGHKNPDKIAEFLKVAQGL